MLNSGKYLVVIAGPTAVGKTDVAIKLAKEWKTEIISSDSRQFYKEMSIGTAKPDKQQLSEVKHHFIGQLSIHDYYNVSRFENEALELLEGLFEQHSLIFMVGGSGLYIDAVCRGIDDFPDPEPEYRNYLKGIYLDEGIEKLQEMLFGLDPEYFATVDINNPNRLLRALEVCHVTGKKFSELRLNNSKLRNFQIIKLGLNIPRPELYGRIELRVDQMIDTGLVEEVRSLLPFRHLNALNTVGYKEIFDYLDSEITIEQATTNIKTSTRRYAKRQLTWFNRTDEYKWFDPTQLNEITNYLTENCK
ncbi:MAG: tRNA (adenosine(37)-N6)-dimethylallyltransferase MiaA [Bacteroidales bacterium]|nr:tRNA (adenosine(37)-N6)-dimethylallyltransferase MiaA [Bacteroidales bacterium]